MGCGNTKEVAAVAVPVAPPQIIDPKQQYYEERIVREERQRRLKEYRKLRGAAQQFADSARQTAVDEISSRLGTLESYWVAGEFLSDNAKPHFVPSMGPMSLTEKVPPAPSVLRGAILFAATPSSAHHGTAGAAVSLPQRRANHKSYTDGGGEGFVPLRADHSNEEYKKNAITGGGGGGAPSPGLLSPLLALNALAESPPKCEPPTSSALEVSQVAAAVERIAAERSREICSSSTRRQDLPMPLPRLIKPMLVNDQLLASLSKSGTLDPQLVSKDRKVEQQKSVDAPTVDDSFTYADPAATAAANVNKTGDINYNPPHPHPHTLVQIGENGMAAPIDGKHGAAPEGALVEGELPRLASFDLPHEASNIVINVEGVGDDTQKNAKDAGPHQEGVVGGESTPRRRVVPDVLDLTAVNTPNNANTSNNKMGGSDANGRGSVGLVPATSLGIFSPPYFPSSPASFMERRGSSVLLGTSAHASGYANGPHHGVGGIVGAAPDLASNCFVYPFESFVGRAYMEGPLGNKSAGWVRLPCGPVTRKRTTFSKNDDGKGAAEASLSSPNDEGTLDKREHNRHDDDDDDNHHGNNHHRNYYFAPEVKGFLSSQKPHYDTKEDGPVAEPVGSHAHAIGGDEGGSDDDGEGEGFRKYEKTLAEAQRLHAEAIARHEKEQKDAEGKKDAMAVQEARMVIDPDGVHGVSEGRDDRQGDGDEAMAGPPPPFQPPEVKVPIRQIVPRRLEKYYLYPKELTAFGVQIEYRSAPCGARTLGEARKTMAAGLANSAFSPSAHSVSVKHGAMMNTININNTNTDVAHVMSSITKHLLPTAYSCPKPIALTSFYQSASGDYFGEDRPDGLAVKIVRGERPMPNILSESRGVGPSSPPHAVPAAGGGIAAVQNLHAREDERPLKNCFMTFVSPNNGISSSSGGRDTINSEDSHASRIFSSNFIREENSIPLHLFGDFGNSSALLCAMGGGGGGGGVGTVVAGWWPAAHRYAEAYAFTQELSLEAKRMKRAVVEKVARGVEASAEQRKLKQINDRLEYFKKGMLEARNALFSYSDQRQASAHTPELTNPSSSLFSSSSFRPSEDEIFWLHFKKEVCAFLARVLEQSPKTDHPTAGSEEGEHGSANVPTPSLAGHGHADKEDHDRRREYEVSPRQSLPATPKDTVAPSPKVSSSSLCDDSYALPRIDTSEENGEEIGVVSTNTNDASPNVIGGRGVVGPSIVGGASVLPPATGGLPPRAPPPKGGKGGDHLILGGGVGGAGGMAAPHSLPDSTPVTCLQLKFSVHGQYNNAEFIAFNGNGRNNVAEVSNENGKNGALPQLLTFRDTSRRPRVRQFAKPLASGVSTIVIPAHIPIGSEFIRNSLALNLAHGTKTSHPDSSGAAEDLRDVAIKSGGSVDCVTHLKYVASVLALVLDEFTSSFVIN